MLLLPYRMRRARLLCALCTVSALFLVLNVPWVCDVGGPLAPTSWGGGGPLTLPPEYHRAGADDDDARGESAFCRDRFGPKFLRDLRGHAIDYCAPGSASALTCFHTQNHPDGLVDSLCLAQNATLDPAAEAFRLGCRIRAPTANETAAGLIPLDRLASYWYDTGPGVIFRDYVEVTATLPTPPRAGGAAAVEEGSSAGGAGPAPPRYALLVRREGEGNLWHCLMEIMTMTLTFDVLRMARGAAAAAPAGPPLFAAPAAVPDTQVVLLDDRADGPYFDLWRLFAGRPPVRLRDLLADPAAARAWATAPLNLIVPLAGAANPLWQNEWTERDCRAGPLLDVFVQRVLAHYGVAGAALAGPAGAGAWTPREEVEGGGGGEVVEEEVGGPRRRLRVTLIDRVETRRLVGGGGGGGAAALLRAVRRRFAGNDAVRAEAVDFGALDFAAQLRAARATDVLVGVHGAGLTHALFLRPGAAVVEIEPPALDDRIWRNLARMRGLHHFLLRAATANTTDTTTAAAPRAPPRDWHDEDVAVVEQAFVDVIAEAVAAVRRGPPGA